MFAAALLASAMAQAEPLSPRVAERYRQMLAANPTEGVALDRLWKGALEGGTTEELLAAYAKAGDFSGRMIFGLLLRKAGRDEDARVAFESAAKADAASPLPLLALGRMENDRGRPREAAAFFEKALASFPKDDARMQDTLMQLGAAWSAAGDPAKAAEAWERMVVIAPDDLEVRRRLAQASADAGQPEIGLRHLEHLSTHAEPSERAKALQQMAAIHSAAGRTDDAMRALERAVSGTAPGNWLRAELLGQIIRLARRTHSEDELEKKWLAQVEANPRDLGGYLQLVEFYDRIGNPEQQRLWLEKITALVPGNAEHLLRLARLLAQMDQLDAAAVKFDKVIAAQPKSTDLIFERAKLDLRREDGASARQRIDAMLAAHGDDELLRSAALGFFQEHRMLDSIEAHLKVDAQKDGENALLALAEFYFSVRKNDDARAVLSRLLRSGDAPEEEARRRLLVAQHLKGHGELTAAVAEVEAAVRLTPDSREALMLLAELRAVLAQRADARAAYLRAYAVSRSDSERIEVDGKLFESIRAEVAPPVDGRAQGESAAAIVEGFIRDLMVEANDAKSPAGWLRVARWKAWNGDKSSAVTFAAKAADMEPKNPVPMEFLAKHAVTNGESAYAVAYFRELIVLNPAGRDGYLREIAQIELLRGDHADALEILAQLVKSNPGSMDALADLALAQERTDKIQESVVTWKKVLALAPAPRRREVASSLLRVLEKVGAHEEASELMLRSADEATDERTRFARIDELLLYCQRHARLPWARDIFEKRRKAKADDYVAAIALGGVLKLMGEKNAAFEMFADAALAMPNDAEVLPELVREAEELRKLDLAVRLQEQFVRTAKVEHSDGWLRLASLQQANGDIEGAERVWMQAVAKFPRDADVLRRAAEFHQRWGDRAVAVLLLGKICALDMADAGAASELGELQFAAGKFPEAQAAFGRVMKLTVPVAQLVYPAERMWGTGSRAMAASAARRVSGSSARWQTMLGGGARNADVPDLSAKSLGGREEDAQLRLGALRRLAEMARGAGGAVLEKWHAEWMLPASGATTEMMWALYFSGARDAVLSVAEQNAAKEADDAAHRQAFIWMALESGCFARLGAWLNAADRMAADGELFLQAFAEVVTSRAEIVSDEMMRGLFPEGAHAELWPCAVELARTKHTREAIVLGRRVFAERASERVLIGRELARWHLALGEREDARAVLAKACEGVGESLESPVYGAMRDLYFLLPQDQRAAFVRERLRMADELTMHGLQVRTLLSALEGRGDEARASLSRLLERRPIGPASQEEGNSALREWSSTSGAANQLIEWGLPWLARHALDVALSDDGLRALQESQSVRGGASTVDPRGEEWRERPLFHEVIERACEQRDALAYLATGTIERQAMLARIGGRGGGRACSRMADALESLAGGKGHAVAIRKLEWDLDPQNPAALRKLVDASLATGDVTTAEAVRRRCIVERINPGNDTTPREFALELADLLEARGAPGEALAMIETAVERNPEELRLLMRRAQLLEKCGRADDAAAAWKRTVAAEGGSASSRLALASMIEERGKFAEAIEVRNRTGPSGDTVLPELFCKNGQTDDALIALDRLTGSGAVQAAMAVAEVLALKGEGSLARSVLVAAAAKTAEPRAQMQVRAKLLTIPGCPPPRIFRSRMQERMRDLVREQPGLAGAYFEFFDHCSARLGIAEEWKRELDAAWAAGEEAAGLVRLRHACADENVESARGICRALLSRADISERAFDTLNAIAIGAHRADLRLMIAERAAQRGWPSADGMLEWVRLLDANGARGQAKDVLARHSWLAGFTGGAEVLGRGWFALGEPAMARDFLSLAMMQSVPVPAPSLLVAMARVHAAANNFRAARLLLRRAFAEPVCHEYAALAEYLAASGELARWRDVASEFGLAPVAVHELQLAIFTLHERRGEVRDALTLVAAEPSLVSGAEASRGADGGVPRIDCARLRRVAARAGEFDEGAKLLGRLVSLGQPDAPAEMEVLLADSMERKADRDGALHHVEKAAEMRPESWEFARRAAEMRMARSENARARAVLERFLSVSQSAIEREAAFDFWERANDAAQK